ALNGSVASLTVNNQVTFSYTFAVRVDALGIQHGLNDGMVGIGAQNAKAQIDNAVVQKVPLPVALNQTADFTSSVGTLLQAPQSGTWQLATNGRYIGAAASGAAAVYLVSVKLAPAYLLQLTSTLSSAGQGGIVFDL